MVIEENENANYLAHYKTKGAKNGIRRFQSYLVQPNPSGATGQEVGEAAAQRGRITGKKNDSEDKTVYKSAKELRKEARRQQKLQKIAAKRKKKETDDKEKWSKSYRELAKHKDAFTNEELRRAIDRLELESRITSSSLNSVRDKTQKGADILKNLDSAGRSMAGIYNTLAGGWNAYHALTGKGKELPKIRSGNESVRIDKKSQNQKKDDKKSQNNQNKANNDNKNQNNGSNHQNDSNNSNSSNDSGKHWSTTSADANYRFNLNSILDKRRKRNKIYYDSLEGALGPYLEHYGKPGQKWYHRFFQSYKTAPTRSGKVGEEHGLASAQAERVGEEEIKEYSGKDALKSLGLDGYDRRDREYSFGKFTSYDKAIDSDTDGYVRFSLDKEDIYKRESVDTMKRAEKEWTKIKATVIPDVKEDIVDMLEKYDNMSKSEAKKVADKMFKPSNLDFHVRPTLPGFVEISLYSNESPYGDHSFDFEYDVYNHKKEPGFAMND